MIRAVCVYTTPHFSGAAVSLAEMLRELSSQVQPTILTPAGSAATFFERCGTGRVHTVTWLSQFDHTRFGRYRGFRWLVALREALRLPQTWWSVRRFAAMEKDVQLIHLNEITGIISAVLLKRRLKVPLLVHVRAHMGRQDRGWRSRLLWRLFDRYVDRVVCIDETVRHSLPDRFREKAQVIHNALNIEAAMHAVDPCPLPDVLLHPGSRLRIGIVGSLLRVKGVYEFVEAAIALCRQRDDIIFALIGGGVRHLDGVKGKILSRLGLTENVETDLRRAINEAGLNDRIVMTGHRGDLANVYSHLDVLCFPSHYNAPGRPIFEAAYFGKPSIVAIEQPRADTLIHNETGLAIDAKNWKALADAIQWLADRPLERERLGAGAKWLAECNFSLQPNAAQLGKLYQELAELGRRQCPRESFEDASA